MFRLILPMVMLGVLLHPVSGACAQDTPVLKVGERFPQLSFPAMRGGEPLSIASFLGKRVVLHVFASW